MRTWTGASGLTSNWSDPANWNTGVPVQNDSLVFPANGGRTNNINNLAPGLTFTRIDIQGFYQLNGNSITLGSGGLHFLNSSTRAEVWFPLNLAFANTIFEVVGPGTLGQGELSMRGVISGAGGLSKTGTGTLYFQMAGANSYQGATNVLGGVLGISRGTDLGSSAAGTVVVAGATLDIGGGADVQQEPLSLNGSGVNGTGALRVSVFGQHIWRGPVTLASLPTVSVMVSTSQLALVGPISGTAGLIKTGPGTVAFTGSTQNTYTGTTRVSEGTLLLSRGAGSAIPGNLEVFGGIAPVVRLTSPNQIADSAVVDLGTNGQLQLNGFSDAVAGILTTGGDLDTGAGTLTLGPQGVTKRAGGNAALITGNVQLPAARTFAVLEPNPSFGLSIPATIHGPGGLTKTGPGTLGLRGSVANTYSGATTVSQGVLLLDKPAGVTAVPGSLSAGAGVVRWNAGEQVGDAALVAVNAGGQLVLNGFTETVGPLTVNGGEAALGGGALAVAGNYVQTAGRTLLGSGVIVAGLVDLQGGVLDGSGVVVGNLRNAARIDVGGAGAAGYLFVLGDYTQTAAGVLNMDIGGRDLITQYDFLYATGNLSLAGTLNVTLTGGFLPNPDDFFLPVYATGLRSGEFTTINGLTVSASLTLLPIYFENGLLLYTVLV